MILFIDKPELHMINKFIMIDINVKININFVIYIILNNTVGIKNDNNNKYIIGILLFLISNKLLPFIKLIII